MNQKIVPALSFNFLTPLFDFFCELVGLGSGFKRAVLERAKLSYNHNESLLDIGCGTGMLVIMAKQQHSGSRIVGIDPDERILTIARKKAKKQGVQAEFTNAGADRLPFADNSFDVVISSLVFHHLPTDIKKAALKEIYRVLKPAGRFLLADYGKAEGLFLRTFDIFAKLVHLPEANTMQDNIQGKIPEFLREAGFSSKEIMPRYRGIQFLLAKKA